MNKISPAAKAARDAARQADGRFGNQQHSEPETPFARHENRGEAICREIRAPIAAGDGVVDPDLEFDLDAIADEVLADHDDGYRCSVDADEFWAAVERHARPQWTARIREVDDIIVIEHGGEDADLLHHDGRTLPTNIEFTPQDPQEWEPDVYSAALRGAGYEPIGEWRRAPNGASVPCTIARG